MGMSFPGVNIIGGELPTNPRRLPHKLVSKFSDNFMEKIIFYGFDGQICTLIRSIKSGFCRGYIISGKNECRNNSLKEINLYPTMTGRPNCTSHRTIRSVQITCFNFKPFYDK